MPKKKQNKKIVQSDSEEPYNSEDDYVLKSEEEDVETDEESGEGKTSSENSTESAEEATETGESNDNEEINEETDGDYNAETDEEKDSVEEQSSDIEEDIGEDIETEADIGEIGEEEAGETDEAYVGESKICYMKNLDKDFVVLDEDDSNMYAKMEYKKIPAEERISDPVMTYYELVRIIGTRAQQFNFGAPPLVENLGKMHPAKMAYVELRLKLTPYIIRRHLPGKKYEEWNIDELEQIHILTDDFFVPENVDWDKLMAQAKELNKKAKGMKK